MLLTSDVDAWLAVFGRFHIVFLHLPIGLLPGIALLEFGAAVFRKPNPRGAVLTLSIMTALVAGAALASGLVLAGEKVDSELLGDHKLAAIVMTVVCGILPIVAVLRKRVAFRVTLMIAILLSVIAGHLGGSLTHKKDFLFKPLERAAQKAERDKAQKEGKADKEGNAQQEMAQVDQGNGAGTATKPPVAQTHFRKVIAPIFERACNECHNPDDFDGDLDLTTKDGILGLDRDEPDRVIVPGDPDMSILVELCELPLDDEDHMPPIDDEAPDAVQRLEKTELAALRKWILDGCKFD